MQNYLEKTKQKHKATKTEFQKLLGEMGPPAHPGVSETMFSCFLRFSYVFLHFWGSISFFTRFWVTPHKQNCSTWDSPRTELLYLGLPTNRIALPGAPHEQNCSTWDSPRTELPNLGPPLAKLENSQHNHFFNKEIAKSGAPPAKLENCQNNHFFDEEIVKSGAPPSQASWGLPGSFWSSLGLPRAS